MLGLCILYQDYAIYILFINYCRYIFSQVKCLLWVMLICLHCVDVLYGLSPKSLDFVWSSTQFFLSIESIKYNRT